MYQLPRSTRLIHIDSANDETVLNGTMKSDIRYYFKEAITVSSNYQIVVSPNEVQIPISFYQITAHNNTLNYTYDGEDFTLIISAGNYDAVTLQTYLINSFEDSVITVLFDLVNYKFIFTSTTGTFSMKSTSTCFTLLGFSNQDHNSALVSGVNTITSDQVCNMSGTRNIYVHSNLSVTSMDTRSSRFENILCKLPITCAPGQILFWSNFMLTRFPVNEIYIGMLEVQLRDDLGNLVDLNNCDWSMSIQIDIYASDREVTQLDHSVLGLVPLKSPLETNPQNLL